MDSYSLQPTWIPFTATVSAEDTLQFSLKLMTSGYMNPGLHFAGYYFVEHSDNLKGTMALSQKLGKTRELNVQI